MDESDFIAQGNGPHGAIIGGDYAAMGKAFLKLTGQDDLPQPAPCLHQDYPVVPFVYRKTGRKWSGIRT
jgi:hypothetical protein